MLDEEVLALSLGGNFNVNGIGITWFGESAMCNFSAMGEWDSSLH
jgi:hypothetical protein